MCTKVIKIKEVINRTSLSISTIYRLSSQGKFPNKVKIGSKAVGWLESDIEDYIMQRHSKWQK